MTRMLALEFSQLVHRLGGVRGVAMLAVLAAAGTIIPMRFGAAFLDTIYLLAYAAFGALFSGTYAAQSWAGADERAWIANRGDAEPTDAEVFLGKTLVGAMYGTFAWAVIYGAALAALQVHVPGIGFPAMPALAAAAVFVFALSASAAAATSLLGLTMDSPVTVRQMVRLAFFFALVTGLILSRIFPRFLSGLIGRASLSATLAVASVALLALVRFFQGRALRILAEQKRGLSILG